METVNQDKIEIITLPVSSWQEYKELRLRALKTEPQAFSSLYEKEIVYPDTKWQQRLQNVESGKSWIFFGKLNGKLVAIIGTYKDEEDMKNYQVWIFGAYVDPEARRKGIAKLLMEKMLGELKKHKDITVVKLGVNINQESAKKLYEKFGFRTIKTETVLFGDGLKHEELIMELRF